jgi:hypothetical protein
MTRTPTPHPVRELVDSVVKLAKKYRVTGGVIAASFGAGSIYVLGGAILGLKLLRAGLPMGGGLAVIPKEQVFLAGILGLVFLLAATTVAIYVTGKPLLLLLLVAVLFLVLPIGYWIWPIGLLAVRLGIYWHRHSDASDTRTSISFSRLLAWSLGGMTLASVLTIGIVRPPFPLAQAFVMSSGLPNRTHYCLRAPKNTATPEDIDCLDGWFISSTSDAVWIGRHAINGEPEIIEEPASEVKEVRVFSSSFSVFPLRVAQVLRWSLIGHVLAPLR